MPRATDATLLATIARPDVCVLELYSFLVGAVWQHYTSDVAPLVFGGTTYAPAAIESGEVQVDSDTSVSTVEIVVHRDGWAALAAAGDLDGSEVKIRRAYLPDWPSAPSMLQTIFHGVVEAAPGATPVGVKITARSWLGEGEQRTTTRRLGPGCAWVLGGADCGVDLTSYRTMSKTVDSGSTVYVVKLTTAPGVNAGPGSVVQFTSGANNGLKHTVESVSGNDLTLVRPLPAAPQTGDTLNIIKGCARTIAACSGFSNLVRFGGFPSLPRAAES